MKLKIKQRTCQYCTTALVMTSHSNHFDNKNCQIEQKQAVLPMEYDSTAENWWDKSSTGVNSRLSLVNLPSSDLTKEGEKHVEDI